MPPAPRVYRMLLRLAPGPLRDRHGAEMEALFGDALEAARRRGRLPWLAAWVLAIVDLLAARVRAALRHGAPATRRGRGREMGSQLLSEIRHAARSLRRRPLFTVLAALTLAVGVGFNTALFAVVYGVMLRPLPFPQPDRLVMIWTGRGDGGRALPNSVPDYIDWRAGARAFSGLAVYNVTWTTLAERGDPEQVEGAVVSANFFDVLRARFQLGTGFRTGDDLRGAEPVVVLSDSLWRRQYNADPAIVGRTVRIDERSRRVVGVLAPDFLHPEPFATEPTEFFRPFVLNPEQYGRGFRWVRVVGRLADGVTLPMARVEMEAMAADLAARYPATNRAQIVLMPLHDELIGDIRPTLLALAAIVATVLVLACANVINALLVRASGRAGEFAIKDALGAGRARLVRQLVIESLLLGLAAGGAGVLIAVVGVRALLEAAPADLPRIQSVGITGEVLLFAFGMALFAGVVCGLLPAWRVARARYAPETMRETRGTAGLEMTRRRTLLIAVEVALAFPLTVGAALLTQSLAQLNRVDKGFDASAVVQARVTLEGDRYGTGEQSMAFFDALLGRLRETPGIASAGMTSSLPLSFINNTGGTVTGERRDGALVETFAGHRSVSAGYFETLGMTILQGRAFDGSAADRASVVVSDRLAAALWPDHGPIGQRVRPGSKASASDWFTVVGVVKAIRQTGLTADPQPELFQPYRSNPWRTMTVVARTAGDPRAALQPFRAAVRSLDPALAVTGLSPLQDVVDEHLARNRFGALSALAFGGMGVLLAAAGAFAVLSLLVARRTREIGIRVALGAAPNRVGTLVIRDAMLPAVAGCLAGALLAGWVTRGLAGLLYGVPPNDPATFAITAGGMLLLALLAGWLPAHRAMRVDPVVALRSE